MCQMSCFARETRHSPESSWLPLTDHARSMCITSSTTCESIYTQFHWRCAEPGKSSYPPHNSMAPYVIIGAPQRGKAPSPQDRRQEQGCRCQHKSPPPLAGPAAPHGSCARPRPPAGVQSQGPPNELWRAPPRGVACQHSAQGEAWVRVA